MPPGSAAEKKHGSQKAGTAFSSQFESSSESEQTSSSEDSDSEVEGADPKTKSTTKTQSSSARGSNPPVDKPFSLTCLHTWDEAKLAQCFRRYQSGLKTKERRKVTRGSAKLAASSSLTSWWDEFAVVKPASRSSESNKGESQDPDSFENWFSKTPVGYDADKSPWLAGPGPSTETTKQSSSQVEDIEVPSLYDRKPWVKVRKGKKERKAERQQTLGKKWFEMEKADVDRTMRDDMELIRMRGVLDPKRFYKHNDKEALPKYFQMGTVVDEGSDFYSSRLTKKERKQTLVEQLMADANVRQYNKRKYAEVQQKMRGKKKFKNKKQRT